MKGWIKIHRKITEWRWYGHEGMMALFMHLLLKASVSDDQHDGSTTLKRGQVKTTVKELEESTGLSTQNIRTILTRLESTGEISRESTNRFSIITISNFDGYQYKPTNNCVELTSKNNKQATNKKKRKPTNKMQTITISNNSSNNDKSTNQKNVELTNKLTNKQQTEQEKKKKSFSPKPLISIKEEIEELEEEKERTLACSKESQGLSFNQPKTYGSDTYEAYRKREQYEAKRLDFYESLIPFVKVYGKEMVREFYDYWTEPNKSETKMRYELERTWSLSKRLARWSRNNFGKR